MEFTETCLCGRSFTQVYALANHKRTCQKSKKRLSSALGKAKEIWVARKKSRPSVSEPPAELIVQREPDPFEPTPTAFEDTNDETHLSMLERRPWTLRVGRRLPKRYRDLLPEPPAPNLNPVLEELSVPPSAEGSTAQTLSASTRSFGQRIHKFFITQRNKFGLFRRYDSEGPPSHEPEENTTLDDLCDGYNQANHTNDPHQAFYPYPNHSAFRLGDWYWNGSVQKSQESFKDLLSIVSDPEFHSADIRNIKWDRINQVLADDEWVDEDAGWERTPVSINVPFQSRRNADVNSNGGPQEYVVADFYHRRLVSVIREKLSNPADNDHFHYQPYALKFQPGNFPSPISVHGELYTSPAFIEAYNDLQNSPPEPGCTLERHIVALMFASDSTHLTSFGNTKVWPLYLYFGNESKYRRCKPSCHLGNHVAYFQRLPDSFKNFAAKQTAGDNTPSESFITFCHRELMHAQWKVVLDEEFIDAWKHGIVIKCCDGIIRRFYPRIFTHSGDYPEKILLASIRNLGQCPCPRCRIPLSRAHNIGMARDMAQRVTLARIDDIRRKTKITTARKLIFDKQFQVDSAPVESLLKEESLVPAANAFSEILSPLGFNLFNIFVPDLMHDFELGAWRDIFIHLLRILESVDRKLLMELDRRYREIPSFGRDTIRKFPSSCSEMKKLAARDLENLLQCAIPAFDCLLPEPHNRRVLRLLFVAAHWHGLAKLRLHTDMTLDVMDAATTDLGDKLRKFKETTCNEFQTKELQRERAARVRRQHSTTRVNPNHACPQNSNAITCVSLPTSTSTTVLGPSTPRPLMHTESDAISSPGKTNNPYAKARYARRPKTINLNTYKFHSLGDYTATIRKFGTTDSYSTESAELEHRTPKSRYTRTSRKDFIKQIAQIERRQARIRRIREKLVRTKRIALEVVIDNPDKPYNIGKSQNYPVNISEFLRVNAGDPAIGNFIPKLKEHILPRIKAMLMDEKSSSCHTGLFPHENQISSASNSAACNYIFFKSDRMYKHHLLRINYTTYDVRRSQDVINPNTSRLDVMILANDDDPDSNFNGHHFWYARVLGIYHVNVVYTEPGMGDYTPRRVDFLWVRWFHYCERQSVGWEDHKLDSVSFPPMSNDDAFGFVDPKDVLRASHIIPAFVDGRVHPDLISLSRCARDSHDWRRYYVNRFVDRDMVMRYHWGLAVGHTYTHGEVPDDGITAQGGGHSEIPCDMEEQQICSLTPENKEMEDTLEDRDNDGWDDSSESIAERDTDDSDIELYAFAHES